MVAENCAFCVYNPDEFHNGFFRLSVGLEDTEDVIADLKQAFNA
jgi:cystathionine beta-lyase/cystathionine gamma-synthase